jgi:hypothetical protein
MELNRGISPALSGGLFGQNNNTNDEDDIVLGGIGDDSLNNTMQTPQVGSTTKSLLSASASAKKSGRMKARSAKSRLQVEINEDLVEMALLICTPSYITTYISLKSAGPTGSNYENENENDGNGNVTTFTRRTSQQGIGTEEGEEEEEAPIITSNNQDEESQVAVTTQSTQLISPDTLPQTTALEILGESHLGKEDISIGKAVNYLVI